MTQNRPHQAPRVEFFASRQFTSWLAESRVSLALTTYQAGKLFFVGLQPNSKLSIFERTFNRCMGLWSNGQTILMSTLFQLWRFENALAPGQWHNGYDRLYVPQLAYTTGDLDIHDLHVDKQGRIVFVNTLFGCLATVSRTHSFKALWKPPFISRLAAEDRCHLNGLAMKEGKAAYVTSVSQSDVADGWRDKRLDGGTVTDVQNNQIMLSGLSMPHSPRWHQGQLWLLEAGTGYFGRLSPHPSPLPTLGEGEKGVTFERIAFCPGFLRGLAFVGDFAIVGTSNARDNRTFSGLELDENLRQKEAVPRCAIHVIDLRTGDIVHWLRIDGFVKELYDIVVLPNVRRPMAIGLVNDEIRRMITIER